MFPDRDYYASLAGIARCPTTSQRAHPRQGGVAAMPTKDWPEGLAALAGGVERPRAYRRDGSRVRQRQNGPRIDA